jgi:hypothetical protein
MLRFDSGENVPAKLCLCRFIAIWQHSFPFLSRCQKYALAFVCISILCQVVRFLSSSKSPAFTFLSVILFRFLSNSGEKCLIYIFLCLVLIIYICSSTVLRYSSFCQFIPLCDSFYGLQSLQATYVLSLLRRYN